MQKLQHFLPQDVMIALPAANYEELLLLVENILYIKADSNYVQVHYRKADGSTEKKCIAHLLKHMEALLHDYGIVRIHHSVMINCKKAVKINYQSHYVVMKDSELVHYSAAYQAVIDSLFIHTHAIK